MKQGTRSDDERLISGCSDAETATLGGGCFWCLAAIFERLRGVGKVTSGYAGGRVADPTYQQVCSGTTGHAEVVQMIFDPHLISFEELLEVFFTIHDPTTLDRQGHDVGTQYRSEIFYHSPLQKQVAEQVIKRVDASGLWQRPVVTGLTPFSVFYPAEDYHQGYYENNPDQAYCKVVIDPKIAKLRRHYLAKLLK